MLAKINRFLTPPRRKAIYGIVTAGAAGVVAFGLVTPEQMNGAVETGLAVLAGLTTLMAAINTSAGPHDQ